MIDNDQHPMAESARALLTYLRKNFERPEFAVARRQQWPKLIKFIDDLVTKVVVAQRESTVYQYLSSGLFLAGIGQLTIAQLEKGSALTPDQRADCLQLARMYERQRPRLMPSEPPAPGQRITAKFKPDSYLGKFGSWHTGTIQTGPGGGFSIPGTGGVALEDILQWVPVLDEEPHDVERREYWEQQVESVTAQ